MILRSSLCFYQGSRFRSSDILQQLLCCLTSQIITFSYKKARLNSDIAKNECIVLIVCFSFTKIKNRHKDTHSLSLNHHKTIARMKGVFLCLLLMISQTASVGDVILGSDIDRSRRNNFRIGQQTCKSLCIILNGRSRRILLH